MPDFTTMRLPEAPAGVAPDGFDVRILLRFSAVRASASEALSAVAITMPPWPGDDEAVRVAGPWKPSEA